MPKDKNSGKKLADMLYGNPEGAAFGVYPQMKGKRSKQDPEAAKNFPVDVARGFAAGALGMPGDIESLIRMLPGLDETTILPTSEDIEKRIPFKGDTPVGRAASGLGILGGGFYTGPGSAARAITAVPKAVKRAGKDFVESISPVNVIKPKGGNWLGGNIMGNIDENVKRLKPIKDPDKRLAAAEAQLESMKNAGFYDARTMQAQQDVIDMYKQQQAVNNWVTSNIGKYVKNQMGTPEDPVRKLFDKRTQEIEAKFAKDMERAKRVEDRAMTDPDPRRQANFLREAERLRNEATYERSLSMEHVTHVPGRMQDYGPEADSYLKQRRAEAGFPAEGMGESEMAKRWETLTDDAIVSMRAGDVQEMKVILAQAQDAERAYKTLEPEILRRFEEHIRSVGLDDSAVSSMMKNTPMMDKAAIIGDVEYQNLKTASNNLNANLRRDEYAAGQQNPFIDKLDPETQLYSGNTADMGFDHVIDVIRQDVAEGRIRPEKLNAVSIEDAVRRTAEFDREMAIKMRETALKQQEGFPLHKEYPEGYRWIELKKPENLPEGYSLDEMGNVVDQNGHLTNHPGEKMLEDALKYEGDTMGHCVGGYCPDVLEGRSRIYSLRDAKGEPHVTVEVNPSSQRVAPRHEEILSEMKASGLDTGQLSESAYDAAYEQALQRVKQSRPPAIVQIKGKQNAAPKDTYLPFVQDFVKSGQWSDVGDLGNTGLIKHDSGKYISKAEMDALSRKHFGQTMGNKPDASESPEQYFRRMSRYDPEYLSDIDKAFVEDWRAGNFPSPDEGMARGGRVHFSDNPDVMQLELAGGGSVHMAGGGSEDDAKPYFGGAGKKKYAAAKKRAEQADVNTLKDPKTYAAVSGLLGTAPDEMGFSVLHPEYQAIKEVAEPAYGLSIAAGVAPIIGPLTKGLPVGASIKNVSPLGDSGSLKAGAKVAKEAVKPNLVIKSKPGIIVSDLIDEDPEIAKRMGALARAKRQAAAEAEGKRQEAATQTQPSVGYRKSTPQNPDPLVGTRFINEAPFGLNPNEPFDLGRFQGASGLVLPWDSQSRNVRTTQVSGMDLPNQIFRSTHGGVPYSFDTQHVAKGIAGSSGEDISKRVKTRADTAVRENIDRGGSGELLHMPITMGFRAEDYALPYSEFSFDIINYKLMTGELTQAEADALTNMVRNFEPPKYKGKKPFADFAGFTSPEGLDQIYTGQGLKAPSGELRKAIADRIIHQKGSQEKLGFNAEDLMNATTYEPLRGVDKGFIGSSVMRNTPSGMKLSPSAGKYPYDTDFSGEHLGRLEDNVDVEALFYRTLNPIKRELMDRETKKPYTRESLRNAAIGAIEKRNENVSQMIDQQFLDDYDAYITELKKPTEYKKGGEVKAPASQIDGDQFVVAAEKHGLDGGMSTLNKMVSLVNMGATVDEAARVLSSGVRKAGGGEVHGLSTADLLYLQSQEDLGKLPAHAQREAITNMGGQEVRQRMAGKMASGGAIKIEQQVQGLPSSQKKSEHRVQNPVHFTESPDAMRLALTKRN